MLSIIPAALALVISDELPVYSRKAIPAPEKPNIFMKFRRLIVKGYLLIIIIIPV
jgi:hypothetical protein